jgi:RNA polymerase sigma-70 factor, ECF subfamily
VARSDESGRRTPEPRPDAAAALFPEIYDYLRAVAHRYFRGGGGAGTLEPTGLVHEAYVKLFGAGSDRQRWRDREHFCAVAAQAMRHILIDHCRRRAAEKRGGGRERVTLSGIGTPGEGGVEDLLAFDQALTRLDRMDSRMAEVVVLRTFGGMTGDEIASQLGVSRRTIDSDWRRARAWLASELGASWRFD